jgi:uncharacterized protein YdeI (YjbR/CyaY-like superfamily)
MAPIIVQSSQIKSFPSEAAFEAWLAEHHDKHTELWLRIYKKASGVPTVTPLQAIDVALCWGWIDGMRKSLDEVSFLQRYSPRQKKSIWSQINRDNVARLIAAGRMTPHGQRQIDAAQADGRWAAAYAPMRSLSEATLPADLRAAIGADPRARAALQTLGRANLFALAFRTNNMKTAAGRAKKIATLVAMLARGETIVPEARPPAEGARGSKPQRSAKTSRSANTSQSAKASRSAKMSQSAKASRSANTSQSVKAARPATATPRKKKRIRRRRPS